MYIEPFLPKASSFRFPDFFFISNVQNIFEHFLIKFSILSVINANSKVAYVGVDFLLCF